MTRDLLHRGIFSSPSGVSIVMRDDWENQDDKEPPPQRDI